MLTSLVEVPINHILRSEGWAYKRLQSFIGQTVCIQVPPLTNFKLVIDTAGEIKQVDDCIRVGTTITFSPLVLAAIIAKEPAAFELIKISGNRSFADELINIGKHIDLNIILEHDLSKAIGDIPAHFVRNAIENFIQWQAENFSRLSQALVEYGTEENLFLVKSTDINGFIQEVKNLQLDTEQLEQRLNKLAPIKCSNEQIINDNTLILQE